MSVQLKVRGVISGKLVTLYPTLEECQLSLLDYLRKNEIPVASSCRGEQVCKKCIVNKEILSCSQTVESFILNFGNQVEISYW